MARLMFNRLQLAQSCAYTAVISTCSVQKVKSLLHRTREDILQNTGSYDWISTSTPGSLKAVFIQHAVAARCPDFEVLACNLF